MQEPNVTLSPDAATHLRAELQGRWLRIAFTTGCGGSGYRLSFADAPMEDDHIIRRDQVQVALDDMAASRLEGAVILYSEEEEGYTLDHPDAVAAVWCG